MRSPLIWGGLALVLVAGAGALLVDPGAAVAETFYVDHDRGDNANDGLSLARAWRHAPGDPQATGKPARQRLGPGDRLRFAGGVRYRGEIRIDRGGSAEQPIVIEGLGEPGSAVIDGSDPVAGFAPCTSADRCGGASNWRQLSLIRMSAPAPDNAALFTDRGMMRPAQSPDPAEDFYRQEPDGFLPANGRELGKGELRLSDAQAASLATPGEPWLAIWVQPNRVVERPVTAIEGRRARFDPAGLRFYTDRPSAYALVGTVGLIDRPGEYAWLPGRMEAVAMLPPDTRAVTVGSGRSGIFLGPVSHVTIRNLGFRNFADDGEQQSSGVAVFQSGGGASGIRIENNRFADMYMPSGQGAIILRQSSDALIRDNRIERVMLGSGMRLSGPAQRMRVENNRMDGIGRTGILLMGIEDAVVIRNHIANVRGVHGNGLSAYRANHRVQFIANTVLDAKQPATFHGLKGDTVANDLVFRNNLFTATPDGFAALISWGDTDGVTIERNLLAGGQSGLRLTPALRNVRIGDNILSGMVITGADPGGWAISGNRYVALSKQQQQGRHGGSVDRALAGDVAKLLRSSVASPALCALIAAEPGREGGTMIGADIDCASQGESR